MASSGKRRKNRGNVVDNIDAFDKSILEALPDKILLFDAEGLDLVAASNTARNEISWPREDINSHQIWDVVAGISEKQFRTAANELLSEECNTRHLRGSIDLKTKGQQAAKLAISHLSRDEQHYVMVVVAEAAPSEEKIEDISKLADIANHTANAIILYDAYGKTEWLNRSFADLTGFELQDLKGKSAVKYLYGPETNPDVAAYLREEVLAGNSASSELVIYHKQGHFFWVDLHIRPVFAADGSIRSYIASATEITQRKKIEQSVQKLNAELSEEKDRFELAVIGSDNGIWDWDLQNNTVFYSERFRELLGYSREEFPNELDCFSNIIHPQDVEQAGSIVDRHIYQKETYDIEYRLKCKDNTYKWFRAKGQAQWDDDGRPLRMAGSISDISEHKRTEAAIKRMAKTDALTGLPNRTFFHERLQVALADARRTGEKVGVMLLDLDHFKSINDTMGHPAGDALLCEAARRIHECVRDTDTVARLGGDEFAVVATQLSDAQDTSILANRIVNAISSPFNLDGQKVHSSASIGVTIFPESTGSSDDLLRNADIALYDAKEAGRGVYKIYDQELNKRAQARRFIERDLIYAMEAGELELYYQPQVQISTMKIIGAEALVRWNHPERGMILPNEFIPVAESTRMIIPLGEWVMNAACRQNKQWQDEGLAPIVMAVNVSPLQFKHQDMLPNLFEAVAASGLDPKWLEIEITEAATTEAGSTRVVNELKDFGVKLAIDDFGKGYSSLSRLKNFPVDRLKIDRSFVHQIETQWDHGAIARSIIQLGHSLNLNVIAEGVENLSELEHLAELGCDDVQGYLFARPMPADQFTEFLKFHSPEVDLQNNTRSQSDVQKAS